MRKTILGSVSLLLLLWLMGTEGIGVLAPFEAALAQARVDPVFSTINTAFGFFLTFTHYVLYIFVTIAGVLLDPTFLNLDTGSAGMGRTLLDLWQISRNLTNILLAFMLLIGAIMTIVFANNGYIQKYAVKFVLAVLLVNFSWFFPRVVLDLTSVLTATIYSIPSIIPAHCVPTDERGLVMPGKCKVLEDIDVDSNQDIVDLEAAGWRCIMPNGGDNCKIAVKEVDLNDDANTPQAIFGGLLWNHARLRYLTSLRGAGASPFTPPGPGARVPELISFTLNIAFVSFFSVMILFPLLALIVCLFIRIPIIWITVGFMPFMFLGFVAGDTPAFKVFKPMEIWNKFLAAAFLPVVVALPFSIGFLMLNVAMQNPPTGWDPTTPFMRAFGSGPIIPGVRNLWQMMWAIMAAMVVWMGARQAFKMDAIFEKFAGPIMNAGASWGKLVAKLPLLLPLPLPGAPGGVRPTGLQLMDVMAHPERSMIQGGVFHLPNFGAGAGGQLVLPSRATDILDQRLRDNNEALRKINETLARLNNPAIAADHTAQKAITEELRQELNRAMGGQGRVGSAEDIKTVLRDLRPRLQAAGRAVQDVPDQSRIRD